MEKYTMVPHDDFTPHGYIDNPFHSWKLNPSGVLRSLPPLGMGWHMPNLGSYVRNQFQYTAHLMLGIRIHENVLITPDEFLRQKCVVTCQLHTKSRFEYTCIAPNYGLTITARYFLVQEHALGCILTLSTTSTVPLLVTCYLMHQHTHNPHTSRLWEHGLYALQDREQGYGMLGLASEGDVFVHGARAADPTLLVWEEMEFAVTLDDISAWACGALALRPGITQAHPDTGWQLRALALPCKLTIGGTAPSTSTIHIVLARGVSQDQAIQRWRQSIAAITEAENKHREADEAFWQRAPQLSGDWPDHWRRGLAYDLETLRMTIRPAAGIISHRFDGMQIQAPRTVLAEAAMDALFFSYADPELAAEVILGHFESSPHPNLPCMREDGSYNMVADDGQICGTAPEWGYPLWCCQQLWLRSGNLSWLQRLYPGAAAYLRWWLDHRRDAEGWEIYECSWESGQDVSSRFGTQQTGGTIIEHVRPVDLQASIAQSAAILSSWAEMLSPTHTDETLPNPYPIEIAFWQKIANEFTEKTQLMWHDGWFRDYDSVTGEWSTQQDAMHLAPVFCDVTSWEQVNQLRPFLAQPPSHSHGWAPLSWPPVVMTLVGAASAAQMPLDASELAYRFIDASYRSTDRRELDEHGDLPGVTREYLRPKKAGKWGVIEYVNAGIEGYGWGALSIHLIMRYLMGLREEGADKIIITPALPQKLRRAGTIYRIAPVPWGANVLGIECTVRDSKSYTIRLRCERRDTKEATNAVEPRELKQPVRVQRCEWEGTWGEGRIILLPELLFI
jgi:hypothetical protein